MSSRRPEVPRKAITVHATSNTWQGFCYTDMPTTKKHSLNNALAHTQKLVLMIASDRTNCSVIKKENCRWLVSSKMFQSWCWSDESILAAPAAALQPLICAPLTCSLLIWYNNNRWCFAHQRFCSLFKITVVLDTGEYYDVITCV